MQKVGEGEGELVRSYDQVGVGGRTAGLRTGAYEGLRAGLDLGAGAFGGSEELGDLPGKVYGEAFGEEDGVAAGEDEGVAFVRGVDLLFGT